MKVHIFLDDWLLVNSIRKCSTFTRLINNIIVHLKAELMERGEHSLSTTFHCIQELYIFV